MARATQNFGLHEAGDLLGVQARSGFAHALEEARVARVLRERLRGGLSEPLAHPALADGVGQLAYGGALRLDELLRDDERRQIRIREVAVVVRLFLRTERSGLARARIEAARLLNDL